MNKSYDVYMCRICDKGKETKRQLTDAEVWHSGVDYPPYDPTLLSTFDRMPSKIEMDGMMAIFNKEYGGKK